MCIWNVFRFLHIFLKRFKISGISTKLIILCCFSLTTDPATWKNSRHLSKGFLYPLFLALLFLLCLHVCLCTLTGCVHFFSSAFICLFTLIVAGFSGSCYLLAFHQNEGFFLVVNVMYFYFKKHACEARPFFI